MLVLALAAVACGGDDEVEIDEAASAGEDPADTDTDDTGDVEPAAPSEDEEPAEEADTEPAGDGGPAEHRPAASARDAIDCDAVATSSPGAVIVFPDSGDPASLQVGTGPVTVEVVGCSDTFEANIQYDAFHGQNSTPTLSGFTEGGTLGDWGLFSFEETYWTPGDWTVVVFVNDAESGNRVEYDQVTFTVD